MKTIEIDNTIIDGYIAMLDNLSPSSKLDLISKLTASIKTDLSNKKSKFKSAFGAFESTKSADEIIKNIKSSRLFNREIEQF